jgi:hypothetical protein
MKTTEAPAKVLLRLRAIRYELNDELAGKSFAEQRDYISKALPRRPQRRSRSVATRRKKAT